MWILLCLLFNDAVEALIAELLPRSTDIFETILRLHSSTRLRVFERESLMNMKTVIAPLSFVSLAGLLVYAQPHIPCVVMALAKFAGHVSL